MITSSGSGTVTAAAHIIRLPILFAEPFRKQYAAGDAMAWPTSWPGNKSLIGTLQLEIVLGANASPALTARLEIDYRQGMVDENGNPILAISKCASMTLPYSSTKADLFITTLPRTDIYQQISFFMPSTDTVQSYKVKVENNVIRDVTKGANDQALIAREMNRDAIHANQIHCVFDYDDQPNSALPMVYNGRQVQDFQVIPYITGTTLDANPSGSSLELLYQTYGPLA